VGLYGQFQHVFSGATHLTLGLRFDEFSKLGSQFSPRFGLVHEISNNHSFKFLYGEAFRAPAENELFLLNNPVLLGNPDLVAESVKSWELIWIGQWPDTGVSLGYFENRFQDAIVQVILDSGINKQENVDQDLSKGFELEGSHQLNERWLLRSSYTNIIEKSDLSFREAEHLMSFMVNFQQGHWNVNLVSVYHGEREMVTVNGDTIALNEYWQLFGKLRYRFSQGWKLTVQIKNLLDKTYFTPANNQTLTDGVPNRGREVLVGLDWNF